VVSKTTDAGATWHRDTLQTSTSYIQGNAVAVNPSNSNLVYVAGYNGIFYKSTNAGSTWTLMSTGLTNVYYIYDIAPNPQNANIIYLGTYNGVYKTTDGGSNWIRMGTLTYVNDILVHPRGPDTVYVGANAGFYKSTNAGGAWTQQNGGLLDPYVTALALNSGGGRDSSFILCGTKGGGMHRMFLSIIPVEEQASQTVGLGLVCTPNPANGRVCFSYCLPEVSRVTIGVYDAQGRRVALVADADQTAGTHQAEWDCRSLVDGVYFVRVSTAQDCAVRKLILMR